MTDRHATRQLSEEEWIVLLDVYLTHGGQALSAKHPAVIKASETLNTLGEQTGRRSGPHFRSPSGLHRQLGVFRRLNPVHRSGDHKVPQLAEEVWKRLANDPRGCRATADGVRTRISR
jgi:hypothetical protein